ncbi:type I methionyl aminopeptidase [Candidatus Roizmanbacteria bacterium RIFCSPHIGHO2_02_FULL_40_9]|uniref:Methionine aminopeptidase n=2 Tax=Candidatus Roizmaniibacteriota TaxID=1752723 RepID=A0A1F7IKY0_9BACT|nr:MAG: type I methionyl aminopeptidase [Candidatus Roizmanbacteria bacterium RIFCSPHIGHO2_02_FULL_40_9]OGK44027.1 MAG: type I methionyl aminopeptidase [Candidatus Roizmanbacteria bacterium RIFCSPLOWO2_01_FULL_38_11]
MISYKTEEEINAMKKGGTILHEALKKAQKEIGPGITTMDLNVLIEDYILSQGAEPGFKKVHGYHWASCICVNEQIVHTPPSDRVINEGDVVTIDAGVFYSGMHTDSAVTVSVGTPNTEVGLFLEAGQRALKKAITQARVGKRVGNISLAFQEEIEKSNYSIVYELTGHGVGSELHEDPFIPCYIDKPIMKTHLLENGMTLALEVMYAMGKGEIAYENDGWSIRTSDDSIAACFEHTIALTKNTTLILT